jgi:hypothetical protein
MLQHPTSGVHPFPQRPRASRVDRRTHAIPENYAADKAFQGPLGWPPGRGVFFIPTSASGLNAVEGFPSALTRRWSKAQSVQGVTDLQSAIFTRTQYTREHDDAPKPFVWTAPPTPYSPKPAAYLDLPFALVR